MACLEKYILEIPVYLEALGWRVWRNIFSKYRYIWRLPDGVFGEIYFGNTGIALAAINDMKGDNLSKRNE